MPADVQFAGASPHAISSKFERSVEATQEADQYDDRGASEEEIAGYGAPDCIIESRPRISWTPQLHSCFKAAVDRLGGPFQAKPAAILELMNVPGMSRLQVKSHLQQYRLTFTQALHAGRPPTTPAHPTSSDTIKREPTTNSGDTGTMRVMARSHPQPHASSPQHSTQATHQTAPGSHVVPPAHDIIAHRDRPALDVAAQPSAKTLKLSHPHNNATEGVKPLHLLCRQERSVLPGFGAQAPALSSQASQPANPQDLLHVLTSALRNQVAQPAVDGSAPAPGLPAPISAGSTAAPLQDGASKPPIPEDTVEIVQRLSWLQGVLACLRGLEQSVVQQIEAEASRLGSHVGTVSGGPTHSSLPTADNPHLQQAGSGALNPASSVVVTTATAPNPGSLSSLPSLGVQFTPVASAPPRSPHLPPQTPHVTHVPSVSHAPAPPGGQQPTATLVVDPTTGQQYYYILASPGGPPGEFSQKIEAPTDAAALQALQQVAQPHVEQTTPVQASYLAASLLSHVAPAQAPAAATAGVGASLAAGRAQPAGALPAALQRLLNGAGRGVAVGTAQGAATAAPPVWPAN